MPHVPHSEHPFTGSATARDSVTGTSDSLTVPSALAAGLSGAAAPQRHTLASAARRISASWHYPSGDKRDRRLDLLRGFAVFVMVVDHFGGASWLYLITGNNQFFTSGAEAFVLISGMVVGLVYKGILLRRGYKAAALKALKRALTLYLLTVVMTLSFAAVSSFFHLPWARGVDLGHPLVFTFNVLIFHETYYLADIPMMYAIFMALVPAGLWLLDTHRGYLLVLLSFVVWLGFQFVNAEQIMLWPTIGNTTFHPAAWQLIFAWAMVVGYYRDALWPAIGRIRRWQFLAFVTFLFLLLLNLYSTDVNVFDALIPGFREQAVAAQLFNKSNVAPGRILATIVVFQFLYVLLTDFWKPIWRVLGWLFEPLGQNSLYSYTMHVAVIALFYIVLPHLPVDVTEHGIINTLLQLGVLLLLWVMIRRSFLFGIVPR